MLWFSIRRLPRAGVLLLALGLGTTLSGRARAQSPEAAALLDEAEQLSQKAHRLADAGDTGAAIEALRRSLELQESKLMPLLPESVREMYRLQLTDDKLFLVALHAKRGEWQRAVELIESEIRFHSGVRVNDRYASDIAGWKSTLQDLHNNALLEQLKQGITLHQAGRDSEALLILERVLPALDAVSGIAPEQLAGANLLAGRVLADSLAFARAEERFQKALQYAEQVFGADSAELVTCLGELGRLSLRRGTPERGAKYLVRAHAIAQARRSPALPGTVRDLGALLTHRGDNAAAVTVLARAIALYDASSESDAKMGKLAARLLLATAQDDAGRHDDAERSYVTLGGELQALLAAEPALAGLQTVYLRSYGVHHLRQGHYEQAEKLLLRAGEIMASFSPPGSPALLQQGCDLGEVYWAAGDLARSLEPIGRCFDSREKDIARVLATGTEEQKRAFLGQYLVAYQKTMNAQRLGGNDNEKLNRLALTQVLRTKGRVLDAMTGAGLAARSSTSEETRNLMTRLTSVRTALAKAAASGIGPAQELQRLTDEATSLEAKLGETDATFRAATRTIDIPSVQAALPHSSALVELVEYRPLDAHYQKAEPELRYLAYVLHPEGAPTAIDLGEARVIDAAAAKLRAVLSQPAHDVTSAARALFQLVMKPVERALHGKTQVFISADGPLNAVPFAALVGPDGFLVEKYTFTYLTSGRDLLRFGAEKPAEGPIVAFANPAFGDADGRPRDAKTKLSRAVFHPLPGTQAEADTLSHLFPSTVVHTGTDASEATLKKLSRPFALHLATHGFFLSSQSLDNMQGKGGLSLDGRTAQERLAVAENPLLRSGLAFAGATGLRGQDGEDGVLTALEASSLDLTGTQLVVLSACQTAEGEVTQGEGVYGLRRALTVAGAESLVMSLWSVDDEATAYLMRGYYRRLKQGSGRSEALRSVQVVLERSPATHHPYFWAAFIPSGNPAALVLPQASTKSAVGSAAPTEADTSSGSSDDWPTATPILGGSLGLAQLGLRPSDNRPARSGLDAYASIDISALSAGWSEDFGNEARGFAIYDRLGTNLALGSVKGDAMAALHWDYTLVFGYRARLIGLFGGARYGSGVISVNDGPSNTGSYFPLAARLELPWFWDSRISAVGYDGSLLGRRDVTGLDVRVPLGGPTVWLQAGFLRTQGKPGQNSLGTLVPISLGFSESE